MSSFYSSGLSGLLMDMVRGIVDKIAKEGLKGDEHFYFTCRTEALNGLPDFIRCDHPEKVTLVFQHDFENLKVNEHDFSVELSFDDKYHTILIPFDAITAVADPSTDFALFVPNTEVKKRKFKPNVVSFDSIVKK